MLDVVTSSVVVVGSPSESVVSTSVVSSFTAILLGMYSILVVW